MVIQALPPNAAGYAGSAPPVASFVLAAHGRKWHRSREESGSLVRIVVRNEYKIMCSHPDLHGL